MLRHLVFVSGRRAASTVASRYGREGPAILTQRAWGSVSPWGPPMSAAFLPVACDAQRVSFKVSSGRRFRDLGALLPMWSAEDSASQHVQTPAPNSEN